MVIYQANGILGYTAPKPKNSLQTTPSGNLCDSDSINGAWENIKVNNKVSVKISLSQYTLKQHEPRFYEECSKFSDERKQDKLVRLQNPDKINADNLNYVRRGTSANRHFRDTKREHLKGKII